MLAAMRIYLVGAIAVLAMTSMTACGDSDDTGNEGGPTDRPSPSQSIAAPKTTIVLCEIANGLPVADVEVTNTTGEAAEFSIKVKFANGDSFLGTGMEFTKELQPDEDQTVRIGNMGGPADAVDTCEVLKAAVLE